MGSSKVIIVLENLKEKFSKAIQEKLKENNIELTQPYICLVILLYKNEGKMKIKDIVDTLNKNKSTVTEIINRLNKLGYLEKCQSEVDKRVQYVALTEKAMEIKIVIEKIQEEVVAIAYKDFTEDEKQLFIELVEKMKNNF